MEVSLSALVRNMEAALYSAAEDQATLEQLHNQYASKRRRGLRKLVVACLLFIVSTVTLVGIARTARGSTPSRASHSL